MKRTIHILCCTLVTGMISRNSSQTTNNGEKASTTEQTTIQHVDSLSSDASNNGSNAVSEGKQEVSGSAEEGNEKSDLTAQSNKSAAQEKISTVDTPVKQPVSLKA